MDFSTVNLEIPVYADLDKKLEALNQNGFKLYWIGIGNEDFLYDANRQLCRRMDVIKLKYTYHESSRGHLWCNWRQYLLLFAPQLFK